MIIKLIVLSILQISVLLAQSQKPVVDIEGNIYKTTKIGNQVWMAENLRVTQYRDGTPIPHVSNNTEWFLLTTGAYCYYDNNINAMRTLGALYNWHAVNGDTDGDGVKDKEIAPEGWHVPTAYEWQTLKSYLTKEHAMKSGIALKSTTGWHISPMSWPGTDDYGFTALPGGVRTWDEGYIFLGLGSYIWTATGRGDKFAMQWMQKFSLEALETSMTLKNAGLTIRLVKDQDN